MPATMSGIEFEIVGHTTDAVASIRLLRQELAKLSKIHIGDLGLKSASTQISAFAKAVNKVDTDKMKALGSALKGLGQVGNSITALERFAEAPEKALSGLELLTGCLQELGQIDLSNLETASNGVKSIVYGMRELAGEPIETVVGEIAHFRTALDKVGGAAKQFGSTMLRLASTPFKRFGESAKKAYGSVSNLGRTFLRIAMYRVVRTVIKEITQAFSVGVKNLYGWSKAMNGVAMGSMFANTKLRTFSETMDNLSSASGYLKNSIGAAVAPFISSLAPAIDFAIGKIVALINVLNQLFALLGGASGWNKAIYKANEFEDAAGGAGGAAKEALRYLAPFDELNVLPDDNGGGGGGGGTDYSGMFEESEFMESIKDFAQMVKDAWASGDWEEVGTFIGEKINDAIANIPWADIGANLGKGINAIIGTEYWTLETINFTNLGNNIADAFNNMLENINFDIAGRLPVRKLTAIIDTIIGFIEGLNWSLVGKSIGDFFKGALSEITEWFEKTDFDTLGESLVTGLINMVKGLDLKNVAIGLWNALVSALQASISLAGGGLEALWNGIVGFFEEKLGVGLDWLKIDLSGLSDVINDGLDKLKIEPKEVPLEGELTELSQGQLRAEDKMVDVTGDLSDLNTSSLLPPKKHISSMTGDLSDLSTESLLEEKKTITGMTGKFSKTDKSGLSENQRTISTWSKFSAVKKDGLSENQRTISTWSKFSAVKKDGLSESQRTINTWSNYKAVKNNLSDNQRTISTWSRYSSTIDALTEKEKTFDTKAKFTDAVNALGYTPTISVVASISGVTGGTNTDRIASGGLLSGGKWHNIPQYASGGRPHGSLFLAGEAGAELVGHVNGQTEVLNQSQLAAVMSSSVARAIAGTHFTLSGMPIVSTGSNEPEMDEESMYRAFKRALSETDFGEDIYLDGEAVYRSVVKRNKQSTRATGVNQLAMAM